MLQTLDLSNTRVGDDAAASFAELPKLKALTVVRSGMSEEGLLKLLSIPALRRLTVGDDVPPETVIKLRVRVACFIKKS